MAASTERNISANYSDVDGEKSCGVCKITKQNYFFFFSYNFFFFLFLFYFNVSTPAS